MARRTGPLVAAPLPVAFAGLALLATRPEGGARVGRLEAEMNGELPGGSTKERALARLAARGTEPARPAV